MAKRRRAIAGIERIAEQVRFSAKLASGKMFVSLSRPIRVHEMLYFFQYIYASVISGEVAFKQVSQTMSRRCLPALDLRQAASATSGHCKGLTAMHAA